MSSEKINISGAVTRSNIDKVSRAVLKNLNVKENSRSFLKNLKLPESSKPLLKKSVLKDINFDPKSKSFLKDSTGKSLINFNKKNKEEPKTKVPDITKSPSDVSNITQKNADDLVKDAINSATSAIADPFGAGIKTVMFKINSLLVSVEKKTNGLVQDIVKKSDSKGRVSIEGNNLVISVTKENLAEAMQLQLTIQSKIDSIRNTISILNTLINTLLGIKTAIQIYKTLLDVQEVLLMTNPVSAPVFKVFKTAIKAVFLKQVANEYLKLLEKILIDNKRILTKLVDRFRALQISVKIQDEANKGNFVDKDAAEALLIDDLLNYGSNEDVSADTQRFTDNKFNTYILKVEKYDKKQLIGRAYEEYSGLIKAQTAPSYFSTPDQLYEEIKLIINSGS